MSNMINSFIICPKCGSMAENRVWVCPACKFSYPDVEAAAPAAPAEPTAPAEDTGSVT